MASAQEFTERPRGERVQQKAPTPQLADGVDDLRTGTIGSYINTFKTLVGNVRQQPDSISKLMTFCLGLLELFQDYMVKCTKLRILCNNANGIYTDRLTLHSLDRDNALICETKLPPWFEWRNPGYRKYNIRGPNAIYGGTADLSPTKSLVEGDFETLIGLSKQE